MAPPVDLAFLRARLHLLAIRTCGRPVPEALLLLDAGAHGIDAETARAALATLEARHEARRAAGGWLPRAQPIVYRAHVAWAERVQAREMRA